MGEALREREFPFPPPRRTFPQERARKTYERLVQAAQQVFGEAGFDATQTPDIAASAGVSVGTFYRYFSDKREVFLEIERRFLADAYRDVLSRLTPERFVGRGQREAIDEVLSVLVDHAESDLPLQRVFYVMSLRDDEVAALRRRFDDIARERLIDLIRFSAPSTADAEATAYVVQTAAIELAAALNGVHGAAPVSRKRGLAALASLIQRALFPNPA